MFDFLTKRKPEVTANDLFVLESEVIDEETGVFYTIGKLMPLHLVMSKHENDMMSSIKLLSLCVRKDGEIMKPEDVAVMPMKLFNKLMSKLTAQL